MPSAAPVSMPDRMRRARAARRQVAALCLWGGSAGVKMLLITSRDTGRWVLPKGWPINGLKDHEAAAQEAWEEAGVRCASVASAPIGSYTYNKRLKNGETAPVETAVYLAEVARMHERYPEVKQRARRWFSPREAARLVAEPTLQSLLRRIDVTMPTPGEFLASGFARCRHRTHGIGEC